MAKAAARAAAFFCVVASGADDHHRHIVPRTGRDRRIDAYAPITKRLLDP